MALCILIALYTFNTFLYKSPFVKAQRVHQHIYNGDCLLTNQNIAKLKTVFDQDFTPYLLRNHPEFPSEGTHPTGDDFLNESPDLSLNKEQPDELNQTVIENGKNYTVMISVRNRMISDFMFFPAPDTNATSVNAKSYTLTCNQGVITPIVYVSTKCAAMQKALGSRGKIVRVENNETCVVTSDYQLTLPSEHEYCALPVLEHCKPYTKRETKSLRYFFQNLIFVCEDGYCNNKQKNNVIKATCFQGIASVQGVCEKCEDFDSEDSGEIHSYQRMFYGFMGADIILAIVIIILVIINVTNCLIKKRY